jgi:hypothetical protein
MEVEEIREQGNGPWFVVVVVMVLRRKRRRNTNDDILREMWQR